MEIVKRKEKKRKPIKKFNTLHPNESILKSNILRTLTFSLIASISVLSMSFYFSEYSDSTTIRDVGLIFGIMVGIIPLTIHQLKEVQRKDSIDRNLPGIFTGIIKFSSKWGQFDQSNRASW